MNENTFVIFKPNHFTSDDVYRHVLDELSYNGLVIFDEYEINLTPWQIYNLWYSQCRDRLLFCAMSELYADRLKVVEITGEKAISKVHRIKKSTRLTYATGVVRNCIHAPKDLREYVEHIGYIKEGQDKNFSVNFEKLPYDCYGSLTDERCRVLGKYIADIGLYTMIHATIPYENSTNRYRYYLAEDEIHTFTDYVCFICDCFDRFDFEEACVLSTILKTYGEVCLIDTNEKDAANILVSKAKRHNMRLFFHTIIQY